MEEKGDKICPSCGCVSNADAYEREGGIYCCEPCAVGDECECGCCAAEDEDQ